MEKKKSNTYVYLMDIRYTDAHIPEGSRKKIRDYRYIIDGDGKEKICVAEEIDEENENGE